MQLVERLLEEEYGSVSVVTVNPPKERVEFLEGYLNDQGGELGNEAERLELFRLKQSEDIHTDAGYGDLVEAATPSDGGFTYGLGKGMRMSGFAVSPYPERSFVIPTAQWNEMTKKERQKTLINYAKNNADVLSDPDSYFGAWNDPETEALYLDVSVVLDDPFEAVEVAKEKDQIAYFDFQTFQDVTVDANATSGQGESLPELQEIM